MAHGPPCTAKSYRGGIWFGVSMSSRCPNARRSVIPPFSRVAIASHIDSPTFSIISQLGFVPADGVYAAWLTARDIRYPAAVSIGNNPTFEGIVDRQIEAHAIDAAFDIYDEVVDVSFVEYIRGMRKFPGPDELAVQMGADEDQIRTILGVPPKAHQ